MEEHDKSYRGRVAIRSFKIIADSLALRGFYRPSGASGKTLSQALQMLSPEIYGSMNDPRIIELKGLEYAVDRLPKGVEECGRITLTAQEELEGTSFEKIYPFKRRRASYRVSENEICFVITRGLSEIYDLVTHLTFLNIEAAKIRNQMKDADGNISPQWRSLEVTIEREKKLSPSELERAVWNLSLIVGRTYKETMDTYESLEKSRKSHGSNRGLFRIIHSLGNRSQREQDAEENRVIVYFTPSLKEIIGHQTYGKKWARAVKARLRDLGLQNRPLNIVSANMHSIINTLYGYAVMKTEPGFDKDEDMFALFEKMRDKAEKIRAFALENGMHEYVDVSGAHIDCQIIDSARLDSVPTHPDLKIKLSGNKKKQPVIFVMDYAFGTQAFEAMDELLSPFDRQKSEELPDIKSISIMGKAGILPGKKGDIMLAEAHVLEGSAHNYPIKNDLKKADFKGMADVYSGPIVTVLGTSLQNRDVLEKFQTTSWKAVGLEMEGGHYQQAISAAIIRKHISSSVKLRYAYYASDNPLLSGQTLAYGGMGKEGVKPTYLITKVLLEKILKS